MCQTAQVRRKDKSIGDVVPDVTRVMPDDTDVVPDVASVVPDGTVVQ